MRTWQNGGILKPERKVSANTNPRDPLLLDFESPDCEKISVCCLSHPAYGILSWQPKLTGTMTKVLPEVFVTITEEGIYLKYISPIIVYIC